MSERFIRPKNAAKKSGISISHMYALVAQGKFPSPVKISSNITAFVEKEIDQWITNHIKEGRKQ